MASAAEQCPFLVPVTADHLWQYLVPAYCRRPSGGIKVPAPSTCARVCCTAAYTGCPGFAAEIGRGAGVLTRRQGGAGA